MTRPASADMFALFLLSLCGAVADPRRGFGVWRQEPSPTGRPRPSTSNCTWRIFRQRLDHFEEPDAVDGATFPQRLCLYEGWWRNASLSGFKARGTAPGPIFFYTGNESPVDEYVNQTGLMWELAESFGALLVFAEHRCEPKSHGAFCGKGAARNCVGYCTTAQALADYAAILADLNRGAERSAVVVFGGSYGGMLSGWMRMKMPSVVDGAIAASAPIWQLATTVTHETLDWPSMAISRGLSAAGGASNRCFDTLRVAWPLLEGGFRSSQQLQLLSRRVNSCATLRSARSFTTWAQEAYFLLAEGNYPFPSTYIPSAVGDGGTLPPWPMRVACSHLNEDFGVQLQNGSLKELKYTVTLGDLKVSVDWSQLQSNAAQLSERQLQPLLRLAEQVARASAVWYNVSGTKTCWQMSQEVSQPSTQKPSSPSGAKCPTCPACDKCPLCPVSRCAQIEAPCNFTGSVEKTFAWTSIVCNDDLSQISARGVGRDFYWPPWPYGTPRNYTVASITGPRGPQPGTCGAELSAQGLFGAPNTTDLWSSWLTAYYGGRDEIGQHRNIVWSNGALDPWSGMGVYPKNSKGPEGPMVQAINEDGSQISLVLDLGAHHLDLMFSDPRDPPCAAQARAIEKQRIWQWCQEAYSRYSSGETDAESVVF